MVGPTQEGETPPIKKADEDFIRTWYGTMTGPGDDFDKRYAKFMGDAPEGHNRKLLRAFINQSNPDRQALTIYLMQLYHHKASGDRADNQELASRMAIFLSMVVAALVLIIGLVIEGGPRWAFQVALLFLVAGALLLYRHRIMGGIRRLIESRK